MSQEIINNDEECCSICLEIINKNYNKVITNCGHTFHCICLMKNVSINGFACPYCRTNISEEAKIYEYKEIRNSNVEENSSIEETPNIEISEYGRMNFYNQAVMNEERRIYRDYNMLAENNIINDNDLHNNLHNDLDAEIINNTHYNIPNNDENIDINNIDRFYSYHLSRQNRITSSSVEALLRNRLHLELVARLTSEHQVIEQGIQAALRINNIRIPPPATRLTYSTPFERSSFSQWRSSNI